MSVPDGSVANLQVTKSRRTRGRILASTISLIREGGLPAASAKRIAERAGMTWGAAQHHFGSKEQILQAVIALSHQRFLERLSDLDCSSGSIAVRVGALVDRMWDHYQDEVYLAAIEIIMAGRDMDPSQVRLIALEWPSADHLAMMVHIFGDRGLAPDELLDALIFVHCLLTGLTIQKMLQGDVSRLEQHLHRCKTAVVAMLEPAQP